MATITSGNLTVGAHSQGTLMSQVDMEQNKEHLQELVQGKKDSKFLVGYAGSPVRSQATFKNDQFSVSMSFNKYAKNILKIC